jgi:beta-lactamase regulating signal transducer with metallopeptidase domain
MASSIVEWAIAALLASSFCLVLVLLIRKPVSRWMGARFAYCLWLIPLVCLLATLLPAYGIGFIIQELELVFPPIDLAARTIAGSIAGSSVTNAMDSMSEFDSLILSSSGMLLLIWALGTMATISYFILGIFQFKRRLELRGYPPSKDQSAELKCLLLANRDGIRRETKFVISDSGPALIGMMRPTIILPADFFTRYSEPQRSLVLQHEFHHIRRLDFGWLCVARAFRCLFWFNPLVYFAEQRFQLDQELSCDEWVLRDRDNSIRKTYGESLLLTLQACGRQSVAAYLPRLSQIKERTIMLRHHRQSRLRTGFGVTLVAAALFASVVAGTSAVSAEQQPGVSADVYAKLTAVQQRLAALSSAGMTDNSGLQEQLERLDRMATDYDSGSLTSMEKAQIYNLSGYTCFLKQDYPCAMEHYKPILQLDHGSKELQVATLKTIAQLNHMTGDFEQAMPYIEQLGALQPDSSDVLLLKAQTYFQMGNFGEAANSANSAVAIMEASDGVASEVAYGLQQESNLRAGNTSLAAATLAKINRHYPGSRYGSVPDAMDTTDTRH